MVSNSNFERRRSIKSQRRNAHNVSEAEFEPNARTTKKKRKRK